jgi:hypothetical protein
MVFRRNAKVISPTLRVVLNWAKEIESTIAHALQISAHFLKGKFELIRHIECPKEGSRGAANDASTLLAPNTPPAAANQQGNLSLFNGSLPRFSHYRGFSAFRKNSSTSAATSAGTAAA